MNISNVSLNLLFMSQLVINTSFNIELGFELAPIHKRVVAYLLDLFVMVTYIFFMGYVLSGAGSNFFDKLESYSYFISFLLFSPIMFYSLLSEMMLNGESVGKRIMGLKIISLDGNRPSISQLVLRWCMRFIDTWFTSFMVGVICAAVTKQGQRVGDIVAGTTVVSKRLPYSIDNTIFKHVSKEQYMVSYPQVMRLSDRDLNTINNILQQHRKSNMYSYVVTISEKVKTVLDIQTDEEPLQFLENLLSDYNYLSQNK
jgi:uncharacterized RDD family membrane protein YckC